MNNSVRILVADDHTIVRSGLRLLLEAEPDFQIVGEALDGNQALALAEKLKPDIILMDISMPGLDGLEATRQIKAKWPEIQILILTMHRSEEYFFEVLKAGASGYILKAAETDELIHSLHVVGQGQVYLYPAMAKLLVSDYLRIRKDHDMQSILSSREEEILNLLVEGFSNAEIAEKLVLSTSTVYTHRSNLMSKLGLSSRHELIRYAQKNKLIPGS